MVDFEKLKSLRDEINLLLAQRPELQPLQDAIDNKLRGVRDPKERARIVQEMMLNEWYRIVEVWK